MEDLIPGGYNLTRREGVGRETGFLGGGWFFEVRGSDFGTCFIIFLSIPFVFMKDSFLCKFNMKMEDRILVRGCSVRS